jgi:hypothetical protein
MIRAGQARVQVLLDYCNPLRVVAYDSKETQNVVLRCNCLRVNIHKVLL